MNAVSSGIAPPAPIGRHHVDIVSGSFGAGHDVAAAAIAQQLQARGLSTRPWDVVDLMPGHLGRMLRWAASSRSSRCRRPGAGPSAPSEARRLHARHRPGAAYDGGGSPRDRGRPAGPLRLHTSLSQPGAGTPAFDPCLNVPVTTYLTDMSVHRLWVHPGVDTHLAVHDIPARQARDLGAGGRSSSPRRSGPRSRPRPAPAPASDRPGVSSGCRTTVGVWRW